MPMQFPQQPPGGVNGGEDIGIAWGMGTFGGGVYAGVKGYRNSPRGEKLAGAWMSAKIRGPVFGGNFAIWGAMFNGSEMILRYVRGSHDGYNSVLGGAMTGAALAARAGLKQMYRNGMIGGVLLLLIETGSTIFGKIRASTPQTTPRAILLGYGDSAYHWGGYKSYFRGEQLNGDVPIDGPGWLRRFHHKFDSVYGAWKTRWPADPLPGVWAGKFERRVIRGMIDDGKGMFRTPMPDAVYAGDVAAAMRRNELFWEWQKPKWERKRFAPQDGFTATAPPLHWGQAGKGAAWGSAWTGGAPDGASH